MGKKIFVYSGPGALKDGINHLCATLKKVIKKPCSIQLIESRELIETNWAKEAALFILPGGADLPYVRKLNGLGNQKIKSFVENGGSFLGICAGSYYAGNYVEFAVGSPIEVQGTRELNFFPGTVRGPACKEFYYCSHKGAAAVSLVWGQNHPFLENTHIKVYYNGGGYFANAENAERTTVLAHYEGQDKLPALIECTVGKGIAILSGAHFEYDFSLLGSHDPFLSNVIPHLKEHERGRLELASYLLKKLGL